MSDIWDYSGTPSANTSLEGTNVAPGMSPANVDDAIRLIVSIMRNSLHVDLEPFLKSGTALPVAQGGTGATTAANALTALGALEDDYRGLQPMVKSAPFTFADVDRGKAIYWGGPAATATIDQNATTFYSPGAVYVIRNGGSGILTIATNPGVALRVNGATGTANAALAIGGVATLIKWANDDWTITGAGLS